MRCKKCGAENPEESRFCGNCGAQFEPEETDSLREKPVQAKRQGKKWIWGILAVVVIAGIIAGVLILKNVQERKSYEKYLDSGKMIPIFEYPLKKEIYINVFVDGVSYTPVQVYPYIDNLDLPDYVIQHMKENRKGINDLIEYLKNGDAKMQKAT